MSTSMIILIVIAVLVVAIVIWLVSAYNNFVKLRNSVEEAFATMDVYLKKRFDLIPNLVETVKKYTSHESETLTKITQARSMIENAGSTDQKIEGENALTGTLRSLFAVSENYPDLKANQNYLDLQQQLKVIEEDIVNARKYYNGAVRTFNTTIETFPNNLLASAFNFSRKPLYEVEDESQRNNVRVEF